MELYDQNQRENVYLYDVLEPDNWASLPTIGAWIDGMSQPLVVHNKGDLLPVLADIFSAMTAVVMGSLDGWETCETRVLACYTPHPTKATVRVVLGVRDDGHGFRVCSNEPLIHLEEQDAVRDLQSRGDVRYEPGPSPTISWMIADSRRMLKEFEHAADGPAAGAEARRGRGRRGRRRRY